MDTKIFFQNKFKCVCTTEKDKCIIEYFSSKNECKRLTNFLFDNSIDYIYESDKIKVDKNQMNIYLRNTKNIKI